MRHHQRHLVDVLTFYNAMPWQPAAARASGERASTERAARGREQIDALVVVMHNRAGTRR
jgi:hypothetical protein